MTENVQDLNPVKILKRIAWPMGVWPYDNNFFSIIRTLIVLLIQTSFNIIVGCIITFGCSSSADEVIDLLVWQQCCALASIKVIIIRLYHKNVSDIITFINDDWSTTKEPTLLEIMRSYASSGNFVCNAQLIFSCSELFFLIAKNLLSTAIESNWNENSTKILFDGPFPQGTKCLFTNVSTTTYILINIFQMIQCITITIGNVMMDVFFFLLAMHICGQLEILCEKLHNIEGKNFTSLRTQIVALSQRHRYLVNKAASLEETFNVIIVLQLAVNITSIALFGISVIVTSRESGVLAAVKPMTAIQILLIQLFLYSYAGDLLTSRVQMISFATYESLWYEFPSSLSKDMYFIMMKASKPFSLSAGKLATMNMSTFSSILKYSVTYFSVFRLMLD